MTAYAMTPEQIAAMDANPRTHLSIGRLLLSVGLRRDLPREYRATGDRTLGWAGLHIGHAYATLSWR